MTGELKKSSPSGSNFCNDGKDPYQDDLLGGETTEMKEHIYFKSDFPRDSMNLYHLTLI
jgi:hypothetical protein